MFGVPGVHNLAIYDALLHQRDIAHILARHEQGTAFMVNGSWGGRRLSLGGSVTVRMEDLTQRILTNRA